MSQNALRILGIDRNEDAISGLICGCVNASPKFGRLLMGALAGISGELYAEVRAYPHVRLGHEIPDIVIKARHCTHGAEVAIVEHKLESGEGEDQTARYSRCIQNRDVLTTVTNLAPAGRPVHSHCIYLTLSRSDSPESPRFRAITHEDLLSVYQSLPPNSNEVIWNLLADWVDIVRERTRVTAVATDSSILAILSSSATPTDRYKAWQTVFREHIQYPNCLSWEHFRHDNVRGRPFFAAIISKPAWHLPGGYGELPTYLHVEPQFLLVPPHTLSVFLHYELDPYEPQAEAKRNHSQQELDRFRERHRRLASQMARACLPYNILRVKEGWNQIGSTQVEIQNMTVDQLCRELRTLISGIVGVVDRCVQTLGW